MFGASNVEPLLCVEGNALGNGREVTTELSEDVAKLVVTVRLLNHPQVNEAIGRITGERERERERLRNEIPSMLLIAALSNNHSIYIYHNNHGCYFMYCVHSRSSFTIIPSTCIGNTTSYHDHRACTRHVYLYLHTCRLVDMSIYGKSLHS